MVLAFSETQAEFMNEQHYGNIAVISPKTGFPHVTPVWALLYDNKIYVVTTTQSAKYKFIQKNQNVGITILPSEGYPYLGIAGLGKILSQKEFPGFKDIITRIVNKYVEEDKQKARVDSIINAGDRIIIEISPESIFGSVH
ncbi:MAG: pyridoxamine 5'-phosphate oxidase family protein [Candidatus Kariarchaeaceae archaeon]